MKFARDRSPRRTTGSAREDGAKPKSAQAVAEPARRKSGVRPAETQTDGGTEPRTKTATLIALLARPAGATLKELQQATGWQPHSVRGFLSAIVTRKMGLKLRSTRAQTGDRRYSIKQKNG
jgi:Protein of unknown function (DUF3489)